MTISDGHVFPLYYEATGGVHSASSTKTNNVQEKRNENLQQYVYVFCGNGSSCFICDINPGN